MRRSTAPSFRQTTKSASLPQASKDIPFPNAVRNTASILDILSAGDAESHCNWPSETVSVEQSLADDDTASSDHPTPVFKKDVLGNCSGTETNGANQGQFSSGCKRFFNVVWGKQSKKKHKTWEGDGILEAGLKTVILKDAEGKVIGQSSRNAKTTLEEGSRLFVGSKEVEIIDVLSSNQVEDMTKSVKNITNNKRVLQSENIFSGSVKKKSKKNLQSIGFVPVAKSSNSQNTFQGDYKPLVMPSPTHEHQWQYNPSHLPVVDVSVDACLARVLRPHQRLGVLFMYECILGMKKLGYHGTILADEMGLGKTLQCITIIWMLLKQGPYGGKPMLQRVLIVTPSSLVGNWQNEFIRWLGRERIRTFVVDQKNKPKDYKKLQRVPVLLISYEMFVRYFNDISDIQFDLLVCDEGHRLKNTTIKASYALSQLDCKRRILLTGTPIQNDLQEFYALVNFVNPGILGSVAEFRKYYEDPILASRQPSANEEVRALGEERAKELNHNASWFILRRTQEVIDKYLPTKQEIVVFCQRTPLQQAMYESAVDFWESRGSEFGPEAVAHLGVITVLKKICNHPSLVKSRSSTAEQDLGEEDVMQHLTHTFSESDCEALHHSGKLNVVLSLLQALNQTKERVVLVSYFTQTLDLLASVCKQNQYKYCRLDGSTPSGQRMEIVKRFNDHYSDCFVFLLSARAGGVGLNLTGASRLVLYDSDWNPATDLQAMSRIWRDGQSRSVFIYRLLTVGSIEEKIFQRQISKTGLSGAVVDPQNSSSIRLSTEELKDLFTLNSETLCLTHEMLNCQCKGSGEVPGDSTLQEEKENLWDNDIGESNQRDCQLNIDLPSKPSSCIRMHQLFQWQHFSQPVGGSVLKDLGLDMASQHITFIFKNSSNPQY